MSDITVHRTPEDEHLAEQERLLAELTEQLATTETEFATSAAEFARFRTAYLHRFAPLYSELDHLQAETARLLALEEDTPVAHQRAEEAAARAEESEEAASAARPNENEIVDDDEPRAVDADMRDLYRRAAKVVHPTWRAPTRSASAVLG